MNNCRKEHHLNQALDSTSVAIRNLLATGIQSLEPSIHQAVSNAVSPMIAMIAQLTRDVHDMKNQLNTLQPIHESLNFLNKRFQKFDGNIETGNGDRETFLQPVQEVHVAEAVRLHNTSSSLHGNSLTSPTINFGESEHLLQAQDNEAAIENTAMGSITGSAIQVQVKQEPVTENEDSSAFISEIPEQLMVFNGTDTEPCTSSAYDAYSALYSTTNFWENDEASRTEEGAQRTVGSRHDFSWKVSPELISKKKSLTMAFNQKKRDDLVKFLLGENHKSIRKLIMDTLGILECEEEQFEEFREGLQANNTETNEEGEKRSIPGIHYPVEAPGFNFSSVGCFNAILTPKVIRTAQMHMKKTINPVARAKAFAWKMILIFFDKREFNLKTFKFCIRQTLEDADATLGQCSAFIAKIVRLAIAIYENPQIMSQEELKTRTNEILIQLHKNVSKVSAEMRGCTWNSSLKRKARHLMTGNADPAFGKKKAMLSF